MPLTAQGRNDLLTNGLTAFTHVTANSDLAGTESATTRQAVTWTAAAAGVRDNNAQLTVPMAAGTTALVGSVRSAVSAGNEEATLQIGSTIKGVGTVDAIATDLIQSAGHGLTTDDRVFFSAVSGEALPAGISGTTLYWVLAASLTTDLFKVSTSSGGAALDITAAGETAFYKTVPNVFASAGNLVFATGALDVDANFV
jgi:hypothetical protein